MNIELYLAHGGAILPIMAIIGSIGITFAVGGVCVFSKTEKTRDFGKAFLIFGLIIVLLAFVFLEKIISYFS